MKIIRFSLYLSLVAIFACNNNNKESGIETKNAPDIEEVKKLSSAANVEEKIQQWQKESANSGIQLENIRLVDSFYSQREYQPVWSNRELREDLYRSIENAPNHGLQFKDYHGDYLEMALSNLANLDQEEKDLLELVLTDAFFTYGRHLNSGKLDPKKLYSIWDIDSNTTDLLPLFEKAISENKISATLEDLAPNHIVYKGLQKSLKEYRVLKEKEENPTQVPQGESIKPGDTSSRMAMIALRLNELNFIDSIPPNSTHKYNQNLQEAIRKFQEHHGIETDAVIGEGTISELNSTYEERYKQILVNMERWRWHPQDLGDHYIIVNIPNYRLHLVKEKDTISSNRVMVGTEARKTPVFSDKIEHIVYNPTWTIPPTIKKNDVIPAAKRNSSYLTSRNMAVFDGSGQRLNPSEINWNNPEVVNYTYRQEAGPANPLGKVKIIYPNRYSIYLHDTPSKKLFEKNSRAQSSGCVRVEGVLDLAEYLLNDQEKYTSEKIQEILDSGRTTTIKITKDVRVHHFYWTAWREGDETRFAEDIYKQDKEIMQLLLN
ncbi:L,D-transpeptidase family protein [Salegentibacter sediminis]|uniref:L,D-transpeptidase family protein n=1 Tax=Salegentibacter sediminis TaxID=1930251 RepID=UPI0009C09F30|nr:L,D-transpeptidase family protein [Salegentibacter sediminis]